MGTRAWENKSADGAALASWFDRVKENDPERNSFAIVYLSVNCILFLLGVLFGMRFLDIGFLLCVTTILTINIISTFDTCFGQFGYFNHKHIGMEAKWSKSVMTTLSVLALAYTYYAYFSLRVYPHIPDNYGGGRGRLVRLLVDEADVSRIAVLGIEFTGPVSEPVKLIWTGDRNLTIDVDGSGERPIVQLDRDVVLAVEIAVGETEDSWATPQSEPR